MLTLQIVFVSNDGLDGGKLQDGGILEERGIAPALIDDGRVSNELVDPGYAAELLIPGI